MARKYNNRIYTPSFFGKKEERLHRIFEAQLDDARKYFLNIIKPRLDRSYKLYISYTGDRQKEIKPWQSNVFVPYIQAVVETLMPRIIDARPEFSVVGRTPDDNLKAEKQKNLGDYFWEIAEMDDTAEEFTRACLIYGTSFLQVYWKKDVRNLRFLKSKDISSNKYIWEKREKVFFDAPYAEWVDNYSLWYDWHNTKRANKRYWFKRLVITADEIRRRYPTANKDRLEMALNSGSGDTIDYASVRQTCRLTHESIVKGVAGSTLSLFGDSSSGKYDDFVDEDDTRMYEVFEWWRPHDDSYSVIVGGSHVPIFDEGEMPIPYDFKESPFIEATYLRPPGEFEGYGIPMILENPQIMLNLIKNQRLDAATLNIHKMWIVNPLANINKNELVTRPFGIIYSVDPNGVREVQFSDLKASAYKEEEMLKGDMRYSSGVDDFSMGAGGGASSATEVRHLRESTLERVRLFINHLGSAYSYVLRYWMDMCRQLLSKKMTIRIIGKDGEELYPIIERDDLMGKFDYKATVIPSIAGQQDVNKKQAMDLFQLLAGVDPNVSGVDMRKLLAKVISYWGWSLDSISASQEEKDAQPSVDQAMNDPAVAEAMKLGGMAPMDQAGMSAVMQMAQQGQPLPPSSGNNEMKSRVLSLLRSPAELQQQQSGFQQASLPINLLNMSGPPPTVQGAGSGGPGYIKGNPRGLNRTGRVDTNIKTSEKSDNSSVESNMLNRVFNIQR